MSAPSIELIDIYKAFGSTRVLEGVILPLFPGEVHSLMGENGAGKSTRFKIMAGLHLSDKGAVRMKRTGGTFLPRASAQRHRFLARKIATDAAPKGDSKARRRPHD